MVVEPAQGKKCARSWRILPTVGDDPEYPDVSPRDAGRYFYAKVQRVGPALPCEVVVYPFEVRKLSEQWKEMAERQRRWFELRDAAEAVHEPDLAELILKFGRDVAAGAS